MNNMWSDKKYVNYLINAMLFLASVNFMHYGQIFIALICIVIFIDNKFKIKVNNLFIFLVLCLFALTFCLFSYKLGIYCVFGFFLPMAYYIGSNLKVASEENIKKVIYIIAFGMAFYLFLNMLYMISLYGTDVMLHSWQYDVWLKERISPTTISTYMVFIISVSYYLINYESNKLFKTLGLFFFIFVILFDLKLGRRMPYVMIIVSYLSLYLIDVFILRNKVIDIKKLKMVILSFTTFVLLLVALYATDFLNFRYNFQYLTIVNKIMNHGLDPERIEIFIESLKYMPSHLFGGQEISTILGIQIHDLWFDVYDYAGILPFLFLCIYTVYECFIFIRLVKQKTINNPLKIAIISFNLCIVLEMLVEPIMTGSSLLLISAIIVFACFEKLID